MIASTCAHCARPLSKMPELVHCEPCGRLFCSAECFVGHAIAAGPDRACLTNLPSARLLVLAPPDQVGVS